MNSKKKILITGGAGFLGSHLCDYFIEKNFKVIALDNLISGNLKNIEHLNNNLDFEFIEFDISKYFEYKDNLDCILHFASLASPKDYENFPIETMKANSLGAYNCLELSKEKGAIIMIASTSEIYGDPLIHPQTENYWGNVNPIGPRSQYDESKRFQEALTMAYHKQYGIQTRIIRIFNTYGERMSLNDGRVLPNFISQALNDENITIYGDGLQTRSFCYVDDLVEGVYKLLMSDYHYPINIGNDYEISIKDFAHKIIELMNKNIDLVYKPIPIDDPQRRKPNISLAKKILNWQPKVSLENGLIKTINYFSNSSILKRL